MTELTRSMLPAAKRPPSQQHVRGLEASLSLRTLSEPTTHTALLHRTRLLLFSDGLCSHLFPRSKQKLSRVRFRRDVFINYFQSFFHLGAAAWCWCWCGITRVSIVRNCWQVACHRHRHTCCCCCPSLIKQNRERHALSMFLPSSSVVIISIDITPANKERKI